MSAQQSIAIWYMDIFRDDEQAQVETCQSWHCRRIKEILTQPSSLLLKWLTIPLQKSVALLVTGNKIAKSNNTPTVHILLVYYKKQFRPLFLMPSTVRISIKETVRCIHDHVYFVQFP
jgi:hypothetical protein